MRPQDAQSDSPASEATVAGREDTLTLSCRAGPRWADGGDDGGAPCAASRTRSMRIRLLTLSGNS